MSQANGSAPPPPGCLVRLTPILHSAGVAENTGPNGENLVALRLETVIGMLVLVLEPKGAQELGKSIQSAARTALLGIHLPPGANLPDEQEPV